MAPHRINALEVHLVVPEVELARALSNRVASLRERVIAPLLDRVCSEVSAAGRVDRIDRIELDLGALDPAHFDENLPVKLEAALREALREALRRSASSPSPIALALELVDAFARSGALPWWADARDHDAVASQLALLSQREPAALVALVRGLAADRAALARIAGQCDDSSIDALVAATWAADGPEAVVALRRLRRALAATESPTGGAPASERRASAIRTRVGKPPSIRTGVLAALADATATAEDAVATAIGEVRRVAPGALDPSALAATDGRMPELLARALARSGVAPPSNVPTAPLDRAPPAGPGASDATRELDAPPRDREPADSLEAAPALETSPAGRPPRARAEHGRHGGVATSPLEAPALEAPRSDPDAGGRGAGAGVVERAARATSVQRPSARPGEPRARSPVATPAQPRVVSAGHTLDELYVDNAGLVLLWPFLDRLFVRTQLLDESGRFPDDLRRAQAVVLLDRVATGEPDTIEFRLPLAKVLCGWPPEHELAREPLRDDQVAECQRLLAAVIDHAAVLRAMPVERFRETFLQREGRLSICQGAWLLQVERRPHDVVLARFGWSWEWVRRPWMPHALRVEW